jgi:septal ring factor EnvC (AmiA/AmiB activator)
MLIARCSLLALALSLACPSFANIDTHAPDGGDPKKLKAALMEIQTKIQALEKTIYHSKAQERDCIKQLAILEKEIGEREERLRQVEITMDAHDDSLRKLQKHTLSYQQQQQIQQGALAHLVQTTFAHYHRERLRLLLEPNESKSMARLNQYYKFFYEARSNKLHALEVDLKKLQALQLQLLKEQQYARELQLKLGSEKLAFAENKESRQRLLSTLSQRVSSDAHQLEQLQHKEKHLDELFHALKDQLALTPSMPESTTHFAKMKKLLTLPVNLAGAKLSAPPAANKSSNKKSYISASEGTPVQAIFKGKVVFAEWLRGVGNLMIIDHGNGYMSLYGNNQKLYKSIGDTVDQGEMIARVGQSGGHAEPGLYFEIRKNGEALDPTPWFKNA